jgi:transposase InsO family protein
VARSGLYARIAQARSATEPSSAGVGSAAPSTTVRPAGLIERIEKVLADRPSYGYRRVTRMLNRGSAESPVNHKRIYRLMRAEGLLLQRGSGRPHRIHDGMVITLKSDLRWCSDCFEIACWNGDRVRVAFSLDCCDPRALLQAQSALLPAPLPAWQHEQASSRSLVLLAWLRPSLMSM